MKIIFDAYPLLNANYTGIPQTTWHIAKYLRKSQIDCLFTIGYRVLTSEQIDGMINERSGKRWKRIIAGSPEIGLGLGDLRERIYFSPHVMSINSRHCFANARIVHDISSITLPEFHNKEVVRIDGNNLDTDLRSCDVLFTVSKSTKMELVRYLAVPEDKITIVYPGVDWTDIQWEYASKKLFAQPYVVLLATREPRKNQSLLLEYLTKNCERILRSEMAYVFAGPAGWGPEAMSYGHREIEQLISAGKIIQAGFIPEDLKLSLLANARYMIFPSHSEGFGSPVAEALSIGAPVVCSSGGSLPEVGGSAVKYFSPESLVSLEQAILEMEVSLAQDAVGIRKTALEQGKKFTWSEFCTDIFSTLEARYLGRPLPLCSRI